MVFTTELMKEINYLSDPQLSPDGRFAAVVETKAKAEDGKFYPKVCIFDAVSGQKLDWELKGNTRAPRFSADGRFFSYLSDLSGEYQVYMLNLEGEKEARKITSLRHGVSWYSIFPDSSRFIFEAEIWKEELEAETVFSEMTEEEKLDWQEEQEYAPIEITQIDYKRDEYKGVRPNSKSTIGAAWIDGTQKIFEHNIPLQKPVASPDGKLIACYGQPYSGPFYSQQEVFVMEADGTDLCQVTDKKAVSANAPVCFCSDGKEIVYPGYYVTETQESIEYLYKSSWEQKEKNICNSPVCLFDPEAEEVSSGVYGTPGSRTQYGEEKPFFAVDGKWAYFVCCFQGAERLYRISLEGGSVPELLLDGEFSVHEFCLPVNGKILLTRGDYNTIRELYLYDREKKTWKQYQDSNPWLALCTLGEITELAVPSKDGKVTVHGWVCKPADFKEGSLYPAVLYIHGGPTISYTNDFWHEIQALAGAGFAVIYCDPRGSFGYGLKFANSSDSWGMPAYEDLMQVVDYAISLGFIDEKRLGITGGSYGGYTTCKIVMMTDRFQAAVAQRTFVNKATSYGTGDMGFYSAHQKWSEVVIEKCLTERARTSIIRNVDKIKTPMLLLHGYNDYRCSFEQSEQMFISMKERCPKVPVRLVMFPGENHEVSRTGLLHFQQRHVQEMIDWFVAYLDEKNDLAKSEKEGRDES